MSSSSLQVVATILVVFAIGLALPREAHACRPAIPGGGCKAPLVLPADGSTIPANATQLVALLRGGSLDTSSVPHLIGSDGTDLPLGPLSIPSRLGIVRMPVSGLVVGVSYRLEGLTLSDSCGMPAPMSVEFVVGPPAEQPTNVGTLSIREQGVREVDAACGDAFDESFAELAYVEDPSLAPWRALTFVEFIVNASPIDIGLPTTPWRLSANCDDDSATVRTASLGVTVAGLPRMETNAVDVDLACDSFAGCGVSRTSRAPMRAPGRGAALLAIAVGFVVLARRSRRGRADRVAR